MNERTVFLEALEKPTAEGREAFLMQACGTDSEMRRRVDDLLRAHVDAGSFIEHSPATEATRLSGSTDDEAQLSQAAAGMTNVNLSFLSPSSIPDHLGKLGPYEILEVMGRGAFGIVLRALDPKLNRVVAIKVLAPELAVNSMSVRRFLKEAQAAAAVSHDHIVTIHAVDDTASLPYLVMECIIGQSLQQKIDKGGALAIPEILRIGIQIASGLAAAHNQGLVHRDIKPANILLENGVQRVKITDFGLARAVDDLAATQTFLVAGTPQYMSPEQAHGQTIDQRSDLFSLGSVVYTMCTGRPAFRADSIMGILKRVCDDTPRPICEVNPEIPNWLQAIVARLMEKKPEHRYQSAAEVTELLQDRLAELQQHPSRQGTVKPRSGPIPVRPTSSSRSWLPFVIVLLIMVPMLCLISLLAIGAVTYLVLGAPVVGPARVESSIEILADPVPRQPSEEPPLEFNGILIPVWDTESNAPWIDLLQTQELKNVVATTKGAEWKFGSLILSSKSSSNYVQVWPEKLRLRNARMQLKARVHNMVPFGKIKLGWDHQSGSPRRFDAILEMPSTGWGHFIAWQYDETFNAVNLQQRTVNPDWTKPITMICEIHNGQVTAQFEGATLQIANGLDPERSVVPLLGVENATWTILEWQVQDLDAGSAEEPDNNKPPPAVPEKAD